MVTDYQTILTVREKLIAKHNMNTTQLEISMPAVLVKGLLLCFFPVLIAPTNKAT